MSNLDLASLAATDRLLFSIGLRPVQGHRFQPTGFPGLGGAAYRSGAGQSVLVESAQSMANRLETVIWDVAANAPTGPLAGISHVTVNRKGACLTDSMLEAHRLNSPYILNGKDKSFFDRLKKELVELEEGPIDRQRLASVVLRYDVNSLIHGVFFSDKKLAGGRLRVPRALSAFIEADAVAIAASGGVKNDHVNPSGVTKAGFGNVLFARDEYTAERITLYVNLDVAQLRAYRLGDDVTRMLLLLALYKVRALLDGALRLRGAGQRQRSMTFSAKPRSASIFGCSGPSGIV